MRDALLREGEKKKRDDDQGFFAAFPNFGSRLLLMVSFTSSSSVIFSEVSWVRETAAKAASTTRYLDDVISMWSMCDHLAN